MAARPWMLADPGYTERVRLGVPEVHLAYYEGQQLIDSLPEGSDVRKKAELILLRIQLIHQETDELITAYKAELEEAAE